MKIGWKKIKGCVLSFCAAVMLACCGVLLIDVHKEPVTVNASSHDCLFFGSTTGIGQDEVNALVRGEVEFDPQDSPICFHLTADITWEGEISVPEDVFLAICLNGHTATGEVAATSENGGIYFFQCGLHNCQIFGDAVITIPSGYIHLMEDVMKATEQKISFEGSMNVALSDDLTFQYPEVWNLTNSLAICTCGHTVTNIEYLQANGAAVQTVDCSDMSGHACEALNGEEAEYLTQNGLSLMTDENGVLTGDSRQTLCLLGNVNLEQPIIINSGMDVKLCLNGFTLQTPMIGYNGPDDIATAFYVMQGASLTVCDCSQPQTGRIAVNFESTDNSGSSGFGANAITNAGTLKIMGGTLVGMMGLVNCGETIMDGGKIVGVLSGVTQATSFVEGLEGSDNPTLIMNGGEVYSAAIGVGAKSGQVVMNGGEISAQVAGIGSDLAVENLKGDAIIYLNGGVINVGKIEAQAYRDAGLDVEDGDTGGISADQCVGVLSNTEIVIGGDVTINIEGPLAEEADLTAEILVSDNASLKAADGAVIENVYEVCVDSVGEAATVDASLADNVVPADSCMSTLENGEMTVEKTDGTFEQTASVYGYSLSLSGSITVNFYIDAQAEFIANHDARVIIMYRGKKTEYTISETTPTVDGHYVFSIDVAAKDYQKNIHCSFSDGTHVWFGVTKTVNKYLNTIISEEAVVMSDTEKSAKDLALKMQNYCMAASYHFKISEIYEPTQEMQAEMDLVTLDTLSCFAATQTGSSEQIRFAGVSLFLQSETTVRFYFYLNKDVAISDVTVSADGVELQAVQSGSAYYVEFKNIKAQDLGSFLTVNLDGIEITYCPLSYAYAVLKQDSASQDLVDVAKSLYLYYAASREYFS